MLWAHAQSRRACLSLWQRRESFELESDIDGMRGLVEQDLDHWRTKGPIGKLRNIVKFIRSSPQRSEQFKRIAREQDYEGYRL
jgi:hypothetical protein